MANCSEVHRHDPRGVAAFWNGFLVPCDFLYTVLFLSELTFTFSFMLSYKSLKVLTRHFEKSSGFLIHSHDKQILWHTYELYSVLRLG